MTIERIAPDTQAASLRLPRLHFYVAAMLSSVGAITGLRFLWLAVQPADLYPDEAQYWVWSQHLALGYYSKPPLVAWLIALTTGLFGDSEFAVRLSAPLLHTGAAVFVYAIGERLYDRRIGFWSALAYASLPGVSVSAFIISTDAALLLFWAAALYAFVRAREGGGWGWWLGVGLAAGLGLLSKYAMAYWMLSALGFVLLLSDERRHLPRLLAALGLALLIYSPNFWWNWSNGFVSYLHTRDNAGLSGPLVHLDAFIEFFGSQFVVFAERGVAPRPVIRRDRSLQLGEPQEALTLVQLLPNVLRWFHRLATHDERIRGRVVFPKLGVRLMRYATVEDADDGERDLDVLPAASGDKPVVAGRPSPTGERHREDELEEVVAAHPAEHVDVVRARTAIVHARDDRLVDPVPGHIQSAYLTEEDAFGRRGGRGQDIVPGRKPVDGDDGGEPEIVDAEEDDVLALAGSVGDVDRRHVGFHLIRERKASDGALKRFLEMDQYGLTLEAAPTVGLRLEQPEGILRQCVTQPVIVHPGITTLVRAKRAPRGREVHRARGLLVGIADCRGLIGYRWCGQKEEQAEQRQDRRGSVVRSPAHRRPSNRARSEHRRGSRRGAATGFAAPLLCHRRAADGDDDITPAVRLCPCRTQGPSIGARRVRRNASPSFGRDRFQPSRQTRRPEPSAPSHTPSFILLATSLGSPAMAERRRRRKARPAGSRKATKRARPKGRAAGGKPKKKTVRKPKTAAVRATRPSRKQPATAAGATAAPETPVPAGQRPEARNLARRQQVPQPAAAL